MTRTFAYLLALVLVLPILPIGKLLADEPIDVAGATWTLETVDGNNYAFPGDASGKATIVFIWATWCPYCKALMPHLQSMLAEYGEDQLQVLALQAWDDEDPMPVINESAFDFLVFPAATNVAEQCYDAHGTPGIFLYDRNGDLRYNQVKDFQVSDAVARQQEHLNHRQRAARRVPRQAARLRREIDQALEQGALENDPRK